MNKINPAENYERFFVPSIGAPVAKDLMSTAALRPGERVLDVACGTGVITRLAEQQVGSNGTVAGLDINPGMLAVARSVTPSEMPIEWHEASAEKMPLPDESFDVVLCQMGLQFIPDKSAALREIARVLAPGGRLILNLPGPTPQPMAMMQSALKNHIAAEAAGFVGQVFSLHDSEEIKKLISGVGLNDVSVESDTKSLPLPPPKEFLWQYIQSTPLIAVVSQVDDQHRELFEREVVEKWQEYVKDGHFEMDVRMVTATARK